MDGIAQHFNAISSEIRALSPEDVPVSVNLDLGLLSPEAVAKRMREMKKPKSKVRGDIFPALINRASAMLAPTLSKIYNTITSTGDWLLLWKTEYVTPIPKKPVPVGLNDLQNISCTQFFSKTYESFVLEWLDLQVKLRSNQFTVTGETKL